MKQHKTGSRPSYVRGDKCQICKKVLREGEEDIQVKTGSSYYGEVRISHNHRFCIENWLVNNPPLKDSKAPFFVVKQEEAEKEFQKIRRKLLKDLREQAKRAS